MKPWLTCPAVQKDMNGDGVQTISDIYPMISAVYHLPGNFILELMSGDRKASVFLELGPASCGGWVATILSTVAWWLLLMVIGSIGSASNR